MTDRHGVQRCIAPRRGIAPQPPRRTVSARVRAAPGTAGRPARPHRSARCQAAVARRDRGSKHAQSQRRHWHCHWHAPAPRAARARRMPDREAGAVCDGARGLARRARPSRARSLQLVLLGTTSTPKSRAGRACTRFCRVGLRTPELRVSFELFSVLVTRVYRGRCSSHLNFQLLYKSYQENQR